MKPNLNLSTNFPSLLRHLGTGLLLLSGAVFLLQGWRTLSSLERFVSFFALTVALAALGVLLARRFDEPKTARTFLGLAAAALPAHFAELGAMLYPSRAEGLLPLLVVGIVGSLPLAYLGFAALCRTQAKAATLAYVTLSAALLVPTRESAATALLLVVQVAVLAIVEYRYFRHEARMRTSDGWLVRGLLLLPVLNLAGRALLYPIAPALEAALAGSLAAFLFFGLAPRCASAARGIAAQRTALVAFGWAWIELADALFKNAPSGESWPWIYGLPIVALFLLLSEAAAYEPTKIRGAASAIAFVTSLVLWISSPSWLAALASLVLAATLIPIGFALQEKKPLFAGTLCGVIGMAHYLEAAMRFCTESPWVTLALLGIAVLVAASYAEKQASVALERWRAARQALSRWR